MVLLPRQDKLGETLDDAVAAGLGEKVAAVVTLVDGNIDKVAELTVLLVAVWVSESCVENVATPVGDWLVLTLSDTVALSLATDAVASALALLE